MSKKLKQGQVTFTGKEPMQLLVSGSEDVSNLTPEQRSTVSVVGSAVNEYLKAAKKLLNGKYAHLKDSAPRYLVDPGEVLIACCPGAVVIRYESKVKSSHVTSAWLPDDLPSVASLVSQHLVQCHLNREFESTIPETGTELRLFTTDPKSQRSTEILSVKIGFDIVIERPDHFPLSPQKPFCAASIHNSLELGIQGELISEGELPGEGQMFLTRSLFRLPVGWDCIEIYPYLDLEHWKEEFASTWAENDILAAIVTRQYQEAHFQSLDPKAGARKLYAVILKEFETLLDSEPEREEILQSFLRNHPEILCPTKTRMWPKLALGAKKTDFVFRDADLDYILVELEKSTHRLFRRDGHPNAKLNEARDQIIDWKRYLEDNLATVQTELGLTGISTNPRSLVVIGRSRSLSDDNRRKLTAIENDHPKLRIMTYDDVYKSAKAAIENFLGPLWDTKGNTQIYYLPRP